MKETEDDPPQIWHFATGARAKKMERVRKKMFNSDRGAGLHFACIYRLACVWPSPRFSMLAERRPGSAACIPPAKAGRRPRLEADSVDSGKFRCDVR
jgi:hypothetical protein